VINQKKRMVGILSLGDVSRSAPSDLLSEIVKSVVFLQMHSGTNSTGRVTLATDPKRTTAQFSTAPAIPLRQGWVLGPRQSDPSVVDV
jgi:hypothetical protein